MERIVLLKICIIVLGKEIKQITLSKIYDMVFKKEKKKQFCVEIFDNSLI